MGQYDHATGDIATAIQLGNSPQGVLVERGLLHLAQKKYLEAVMDFSELIEQKEAQPGSEMGRTWLERIDLQMAIIAPPRFDVGIITKQEMDKHFDSGLSACNKIIALHPNSAPSLMLRGTLLEVYGRVSDAQADFARAEGLRKQRSTS